MDEIQVPASVPEVDASVPEDRMAAWKAKWQSRSGEAGRGRANRGGSSGGGAVYGIGLIGAAVYFFGSAETNADYALAIPKAVVWPAIVVYRLLKFLSA
jgi:hypothetical protein